MTNEAAEHRAPGGAGAAQGASAPSAPAGDEPTIRLGPVSPPGETLTASGTTTAPGETGGPAPTAAAGTTTASPGATTAADGDGPTFVREHLVRPTDGRYVAGVCAALGRATNTDPVLWRVVCAVLGFSGGIGILVYLVGWLTIPDERDTASPIESLLGRGRSQMSPLSVLLLGAAATLTFAFIVSDGLRAAALGAAVLAGVALLRRRGGATRDSAARMPHPAPAPPAAPTVGAPVSATTPTAEPVTAPLPPVPPGPIGAPGYRPPFAPHGPWGAAAAAPEPWAAPATAPAPAPPAAPTSGQAAPTPPRQRSKLGRITFFLLLVTVGAVALADLGGLATPVSAYFAAALTTIAAGLVVGAWFGRARGLIALGTLTAVGLGVASAGEQFGGTVDETVWRPYDVAAVAERYETAAGDATLDLRAVDFTGQRQETTVRVGLGKLRVLLPPTVDATVTVDLRHGRTRLFHKESSGTDVAAQRVDDAGVDGPGGGELRLTLTMSAGDVEVTR